MNPKPIENIFQKSKKQIRAEENKLTIIADHREKNSLVISELIANNIQVEIKNLPVADFLAGNIAIERKTISDFLNSMINKRLSQQLIELKQYPQQLLIIEGIDEHELYNDTEKQGIHPNAIRGFLLDILLKYQVPIIFTKDYADTAKFLLVLLKKSGENNLSLRAKKKAKTPKEQLQFILEGIPGIGPKTAKKLLKKFKTIKNIINTPADELKKLIGKKADIFQLLDKNY